MLVNTACKSTMMSLLVVNKTGLKGSFTTKKHSLSKKMTKPKFIGLLKMINELGLFDRFLKSRPELLESKGLASQFTKMDMNSHQQL